MKTAKRVRSLLLAIVAVCLLLPACSIPKMADDKTATSAAQTAEKQKEEIYDLVFLTNLDRGAKPLKDGGDRILDEIKKRYGINLIVNGVVGATVGAWDKVNVVIASGELPDVVNSEYPSAATSQWIKEGILIPLNDYFGIMPTVKQKIEERGMEWTAIDGKYYGYPFIEAVTNEHFYYRKDILDKYGLKYTGTLENFYNICKELSTKEEKTYGFSGSSFNFIFAAYGVPYADYALDENGNAIPRFEHPNFKDGIVFIKKMWEEGLMDPEFMLQDKKKRESQFANGQIVFTVDNLFRYLNQMDSLLKSVNPDGILEFADPPSGPDGKRGLGTLPKKGMLTSITKAAKNPEKAAIFIEFLLSKEGRELLELGIEGIHYTKQGDTIIYNEEEREKDNFSPNGWSHPLAWGSVMWPITSQYLPQTEPNREAAIESVVVANRNVYPNLIPIVPDADLEYGKVVAEIYNQYFLDMIMGKIGIDEGLKELSQKWRSQGGNIILKEVDEYLKNIKK